MLSQRVAGATPYRDAACEMRMDVSWSRFTFRQYALLEGSGSRGKHKAQHASRRAGDRTTTGFERASSSTADTIRGQLVVPIGIRNGGHGPILSDAQGGQYASGGEWAHIVRSHKRSRLCLPANARGSGRHVRSLLSCKSSNGSARRCHSWIRARGRREGDHRETKHPKRSS